VLYATDGGEHYFDFSNATESDSGLRLVPYGAGYKLIHPDGSCDLYEKATPARPVFGPMHERGLRVVKAAGKVSLYEADGSYTQTSAENEYSEFDNTSPSAPLGTILGYQAHEVLLTKRVDAFGNAIHLNYDTNNLLIEIVDYDNRTNRLEYTAGKLTRVNLAYDKTALFGYTDGFLTSIRDAANMDSFLQYTNTSKLFSIAHGETFRTNYYVSRLITPYGATDFEHFEAPLYAMMSNPPTLNLVPGTLSDPEGASFGSATIGTRRMYLGQMGGAGQVNRACRVTNPDGSQELFAYRYDSTGLVATNYATNQIPYSANLSGFDDGWWTDAYANTPMDARLTARNSFYWNRQQSALLSSINLTNLTSSQLQRARMTHWLATSHDGDELSGVASFVRPPSPDGFLAAGITWFDYSGKPAPWQASAGISASVTARVLPDETVAFQSTSFTGEGLPSSIAESHTLTDGSIGTRYFSFSYEDATATGNYGGHTYSRLASVHWPGGSLARTFSTDGKVMEQTDSLNNTTTVFFNSRHQVSGVVRANGATTTNLYGTDGFLSKQIHVEAGATNTYAFVAGRLATNTTPLGLKISYTYDQLDRLLTAHFPDGTYIQNNYNKLDLVGRRDRLGKWSTATYNAMRQLETFTDAKNQTTHYEWCLCGALESITDPLNKTTVFTRDNNGHVTSVTTSDGFTTTYHRDIFGRVTQVLSDAGLNLAYGYNNQGLVNYVQSPAGTVFAATYDANDRPLWVTDSRGISVTNTYDALGRLLTRQNALGHTETFTYNAQGLTQHQDPLNRFTKYGYDPAGRLAAVTNANEEVVQLGYNPIGQLVSLTDGRNNTKRWAYDFYGRQIAETNAAGVLVKTNGYNANGWLTAQWTAAKGKTTFGHDANGNLTTIVQPNSGTISYTYDALDRLASFTSGIGASTLGYHNWGAFRGALASEDGPWASDTVTYGYTEHKLTSIGLGSWTHGIGYDAALRPNTFTSAVGTFTYGFNGASRQVDTLTMPNYTMTHDYDEIGALTLKQLRYGSSSGTVLDSHGYAYDPVGLITNLTRLNGVKVDYGYDPIGQLISAQAFESGGAPRLNEQFGYGYDASHNLAFRTNNTLLQAFTSNAKDELASIVREGTLTVSGSVTGAVTSLGVNGTNAVIYSDGTFATTSGMTLNDGNNLFVTAGSNSSGALVVSTKMATKLPVTVSPVYDLNGNLVSDGLKGFEYDDANQLVRVTVTNQWRSEFVYDALGRRRISKDYTWSGASWTLTNEVRYVWDGMAVLQERDGANAVQVTYTRGLELSGTMQGAGGIGGLLARTDSSGTAFYHSDAGGNVTTMTDSSGNVVARYLYDPFGNLLAKSGALADVNKYRFSSKEVHPNSGLYYYGYRFYEPNLQRWLNQDPIREAGGMNLYGFVHNDPINAIDSLGLVEPRFNPVVEAVNLWNGVQDIVSEGIYYACYAPPPAPLPPGTPPFQVTLAPPVLDLTLLGAGMMGPRILLGGRGTVGTAEAGAATRTGAAAEAGAAANLEKALADAAKKMRDCLKADKKQLGKKFGEHKDPSRSGYRTPEEYRDLAEEILNDPNAKKTSYPSDAPQYPGETHYQVGSDLLRLDADGNFRSLYPLD
jgi:RHS repeat-associated protein